MTELLKEFRNPDNPDLMVNVPLLQLVKIAIMREPLHFDMSTFVEHETREIYLPPEYLTRVMVIEETPQRCFTEACIAGHGVFITEGPVAFSKLKPIQVEDRSRIYFGLTEEQADALYYVIPHDEAEGFHCTAPGWPEQFKNRLIDDPTDKAHFVNNAQVACDMIDFFLSKLYHESCLKYGNEADEAEIDEPVNCSIRSECEVTLA